MQRRVFLTQILAGAAVLTQSRAFGATLTSACRNDLQGAGILGSSMGFFEIRHQHEFFIPVNVLIQPPAQGYQARCTSPISGKSDLEGLSRRTDDKGAPLDLSQHAHTVTLLQEQLELLAQGRFLTIDMPKFGHQFYFVADDATLTRIRQERSRR